MLANRRHERDYQPEVYNILRERIPQIKTNHLFYASILFDKTQIKHGHTEPILKYVR